MANSKEIILTQAEVDAGKAPPHTSCSPITRDGKQCYVFSGKTGSKKSKKAPKE